MILQRPRINQPEWQAYWMFNETLHSSILFICRLCVCEHAQSCPTLCDPMDCSLPGSSVHGIFQVRILERSAIPSSKGTSQPRGQTLLSCVFSVGKWILYHWATWEALICKLSDLTKATIFWGLMGQALCKRIWYTIIHNPHNNPVR